MTAVEALVDAITLGRAPGRAIRLACEESGVDLHEALALADDLEALKALFSA